LEQKIKLPLANLMQSQWASFAAEINGLESSVAKETPSEISKKLEQTILKNHEIIAALTTILNDMIDIQDFNEVIDMVRDLLNNQDKVLEKTKQEQKKRVLDLLK
jgi:leucyl-tRNA synthetase